MGKGTVRTKEVTKVAKKITKVIKKDKPTVVKSETEQLHDLL